ncbi:MAG: HIT family protein [Planctomycetota bacterium]
MTDDRSVFEKIVAGELPCHRLYEDRHCLAFLDVGPLARGHCLLIPKVRYVELDDVPPEVAAALGAALPKLVAAVKAATGCDGLNVLQNNGAEAGQVVMHVHFHLIPRYAPPPPAPEAEAGPGGVGLDFDWPAGSLDPDDAADLARRITAALTEH